MLRRSCFSSLYFRRFGQCKRCGMRMQSRHFNGSVGLVGVPNVGKSLFFNVLSRSNLAVTANYPFCTVEPNVTKTTLPDLVLPQLASAAKSQKVVLGSLDIRDIAGLIKGAHNGAGLGNLFLSHIRDVSVIVHVVRCFKDPNVSQLQPMTPVDELEAVTEELILADIDIVKKRLAAAARAPDTPENRQRRLILERLMSCVNAGRPGRVCSNPEDRQHLHDIPALTVKPAVVVCNMDAEDVRSLKQSQSYAAVAAKASDYGIHHVLPVPVQLESEILALGREDPTFLESYMEEIGIKTSTVPEVFNTLLGALKVAYYYTVGPEGIPATAIDLSQMCSSNFFMLPTEAKIWFYKQGATVAQAAAAIHSTFPQRVTTAQMCPPVEFLQHGSWDAVARKGLLATLNRDAPMLQGQVVQFRLKNKK